MIYIFNMGLGQFYWCGKDEAGCNVFDWVYSIKDATAVKREHLKEKHLKNINTLNAVDVADKDFFE